MEFRLTYEGPLPAERCDDESKRGRAEHKHRLRKHFHLQLRELWKQHPDVRSQAESFFYISDRGEYGKHIVPVSKELKATNVKTWIEHIADGHERCGGRLFHLLASAEVSHAPWTSYSYEETTQGT